MFASSRCPPSRNATLVSVHVPHSNVCSLLMFYCCTVMKSVVSFASHGNELKEASVVCLSLSSAAGRGRAAAALPEHGAHQPTGSSISPDSGPHHQQRSLLATRVEIPDHAAGQCQGQSPPLCSESLYVFR